MSIIFKIARNELRNLFYSPVAWFLAIVFFIQCAVFFTKPLQDYTIIQEQALQFSPKFKDFGSSLTRGIFLGSGTLISMVIQNLYLFIPLLTMGLISRDINNGTIKLLYSSPVRLREIVLGKYLAILIYNLILLGIVGIFIVTGAFSIKSIDMGVLLSAALGIYLLVSTFSAIGLFMSCLSTYQIVSGISTFVAIFILSNIGSLWQKYDFIRDLTYFLSLSGRTTKMVYGLITTKDLFYFLIIICMFLGFTLIKLRSERESIRWATSFGRYVGLFIVAVLLGYVTSRPFLVGYWDTTALQLNTLDKPTQALIKKMGDEPLEVTLYTNLMGERIEQGLPQNRNLYLANLWDKYLRFKPDIKFNYVYYYYDDGTTNHRTRYKQFPNKSMKEIAEIIARMSQLDTGMFIGPEEIKKQINPNDEDGALFLQLRYKNRKMNLRTFSDPTVWPDEMQIASTLKSLIEGKAPHVYFLTGNLERSIFKTGEREYFSHVLRKTNRVSLVNLAFQVDTINLDQQNIPADITTLVIADPKTALSSTTLDKLSRYIASGGNMIVYGEPDKQAIINPVLQPTGVQLQPGLLVQLSKNETPDKVISYATEPSLNIAKDFYLLLIKREREKKNYDDTLHMPMPGVAALAYQNNGPFKITPFMQTARDATWLKQGKLVLDSVPPVFQPKEGDTKAPYYVTAAGLSRQVNGKEQRIIIAGDADYKNNLRFGFDQFINAFYSWTEGNAYPVYLRIVTNQDSLFTISSATAGMLRMAYVWVLPGLLILLSAVLLIRRRRK